LARDGSARILRSPMSTSPADRRLAIERRLRSEPTVWLSSTRPDGRPHVVPAWFSWDGEVFDVFSKPNAQKVRNVREHPAVMLAIGQPNADWDVELVEGHATVLDRPTEEVVQPQLFDKYAALMARAALDRTTFVITYSQPVRIMPTRFLGYGGTGWTDPALTPDGDDDVSGHVLVPTPQHALLQAIATASERRDDIGLLALEE
jgi:PPOX class probable F420-dependent enzyme